MNLCRGCGEEFASVSAFDRHRVGLNAYLYAEGLTSDPPVEDGRRCLDVDELRSAGMEPDGRGRWCLVAKAEHARKRFSDMTGMTESRREAELAA
jgi:hypothetical protein